MGEVSTMKAEDWSSHLSQGSQFPLVEADRFQSLWSTARVPLASYLACFLPHRAMIEDCLQDVAVLAWQKAPKERGPDEFLAYCMACAKRAAKVAIRKQRIGRLQFLAPDVVQSLAEAISQQEPSPAESDQRLVALRHCLSQLDEGQREILEARYNRESLDTLKSEAERRQRSLDSIYKQLERIRTALRNCVTRNLDRET